MKKKKEINDENTRVLNEQLRDHERQRGLEKQMLENERQEFRKKMEEEQQIARETERVCNLFPSPFPLVR